MGQRRATACVVLAAAASVAAAAAAAASARAADVDVVAELGPELDTNARRQPEDVDRVSTPLLRVVGDGHLQLRTGRHSLSASYGGGAKLFFRDEARAADELVQRASLGWGYWVRQRTSLQLVGGYYDAFQRESRQDFRSGSGALRLTHASASQAAVALQLGYQGLQYKPYDDHSFHGLAGGLTLSCRLAADPIDDVWWQLRASYLAALRRYQGPVLGEDWRLNPCEEPISTACGTHRQDLGHTLLLSADYLGNALARLWYSIEGNSSNSLGETFVRHSVGISFTTAVCWGVSLTVKGVLRLSRFRDALVRPSTQTRFADIDDENRSTMLARLERDLSRHLSVVLSYSVYVNESTIYDETSDTGRSARFLRQLVFGGVRLWYGSGDP